MPDVKMSADAAQQELSRIEEDLDAQLPDESRRVVLRALASGRLEWDASEQEFSVELRKPIEAGTTTVSQMTIREPSGGEISKANRVNEPFEQTMKLISYVTGHPVGYIERLGSRDLTLLGVLMGFFS